MPSVSAGYSFTSATDPITHTKLNLVAQPTVTLSLAETISILTVSEKLVFTTGSTSTSGTTAIPLTTVVTKLTTGGAHALTLADGTDGQVKVITMVAHGGDGTLTPTTKTGYSTITFNSAGDSVTLQFYTTLGWMILSNYGATVA